METNWHLRARGVIYHNGKFLVCKNQGMDYTYFPGGHVEDAESLPFALKREILEETGRNCEVVKYLGAIEQVWNSNDKKEWEITHFFEIKILDLDKDSNLVPAEPEKGYEFLWLAPEEIKDKNLFPLPLQELLISWSQGDKSIWWGSRIE
jgi:8-oxo-dGTP pyrophosphatase MutT (NUDIX family)